MWLRLLKIQEEPHWTENGFVCPEVSIATFKERAEDALKKLIEINSNESVIEHKSFLAAIKTWEDMR